MRLEVIDSALHAGVSPGGPTREDLVSAMRRAQVAYVRSSLGHQRAELDAAGLDALRRHATYLDLLAQHVGAEQAADAWHVVGTIFEWLSRIAPTPDAHAAMPSLTRGPIGDLVRSSLSYASGLHEASSAFAGERALREFDRLAVGDPVVDAAGRVILQLLARRYTDALGGMEEYGRAVQQRLGAADDVEVDWPALGALGRIAEAAACQAAAMTSGSEDLFNAATARFAEAALAAARVSDDLGVLAGRLARVAGGMTERSTYRVLREAGLPTPVIRPFAAGRPELWLTQVTAIQRGLLDPDGSFVLSLPTGSGKTFLSQLRILATFERYPDCWVAFVAPARALVREAHADLAAALRPHRVRVQKVVAGAEATSVVGRDELPALTRERTCAVLTPERLDLYLRTSPELARRLRLVIVDECHHIAAEDRGPRLEALVGLLRSRWPEAKPVLMSAFMSNAAELRAWLGEDAGSFTSTSRPTRQLRGLIVRHNERRLPDLWFSGDARNPVQSDQRVDEWLEWHSHRRAYDVGALLSTSDSPAAELPTDVRAYALPAITRGTSWTAHKAATPRRRAQVVYNEGTKASDVAVDVGVALAAHPGLVLMFFPTVDGAQKAAREIAGRLPVRGDLEPFASAVAAALGDADELVECLRHGCAFHHAQLPDEVIRLVEAASLAGLEVLCSTSGLQAGVNLPASIVVALGDPRYPVGSKPSARDFANMAGRAGRPGHETQGIALFLPSNITSGSALPGARRYLAPRAEDSAVTSELGRLLSGLPPSEDGYALEDLPEPVQQALLMLWATDARDAAAVSRFLAHTFGGAAYAEQLGPDLAGAVERASARGGRRFTAFAKTALPYSTLDALAGLVPLLTSRFADEDLRAAPAAQAVAITELLLTVPYFHAKAAARLGEGFRPAVAADIVAGWVDGATYEELGARLGLARPSRAVRIVNEITGYLAWGAGSLLTLAAADGELEGPDPMLPYLLRFGVNSAVAAYLRLLGVSDRRGSLAVALRYPEGRDVDFVAVDEWTRSPEGRAAVRDHYADNDVGRSATERDLGIELVPPTALPTFFSASGAVPGWVAAGTFVRISRLDDTRWSMRDVVSQSDWAVESAPGPGVAVVSGLEGQRLRAVLFVPRGDQGVLRVG